MNRMVGGLLALLVGCVPQPQTAALDDVIAIVGTPEADAASVAERLTALEATVAAQQETIGSLSTQVNTLSGGVDLTELVDSVAANTTSIQTLEDAVAQSVMGIFEDTTFSVSSVGELTEILAELAQVFIASDAVVTIAPQPGEYLFPDPLVVDLQQGERVHIVGSGNDVVFRFTSDTGVIIPRRAHLGLFDAIELFGNNDGATRGFDIEGTANLGDSVIVREFGKGVWVGLAGALTAGAISVHSNTGEGIFVNGVAEIGAATISNNGSTGVAAAGGNVLLFNATVSGNTFGISVQSSASFVARGTIISGSIQLGARVGQASLVLNNCTISGNGTDGIYAEAGANVQTFASTITNNGGYGVLATANSTVRLVGTELHTNTLGDSDPVVGVGRDPSLVVVVE